MILLAIESGGESCSAALWDRDGPAPGGVRAWRALEPARGQTERLIELVEAVLADAGLGYDALGALAVNHGPGSFTGLRSAVAAGRGLALAADLGVVAVSSLEALACGLQPDAGDVLAAIDARRGEVYAQRFGADLRPLPGPYGEPRALSPRAAAALATTVPTAAPLRLVGSGARLIQAQLPPGFPARCETVRPDARLVALCAARRLTAGERPVAGFAVRPLYLRAPDARPSVPLVAPRAVAS
ncbi:MAG TPA: tRNA (adenosine(37)-N6)-threonylcarbamoyltransferase complex dimerization subunit type 1 TsaB [Geminicoccaceae bacterium]|nr:tRNA (adenosine(37)-N6)-threonylcarbamoyltransferase complex dimerization subunit type 1 TsaB [Geminicoccaceae bacterium]